MLHTHTHTHTLDKNGSLYDPAGTESWNMQIRYETMTHFRKNWQVRHGDQPWYHKHWIGVFVGTWPIHAPGAPCIKFNLELERERTKEEKEREEVLHLFRCYTHTPGRSRVNPERQEEEKSGHTKGKRPKTAQGGEGNRRTSGTNLHGETDLNKTAHTPKPHDTLRRGTRGKLGTKWGTSWWPTGKPKQLTKNRIQFLNA